MELKIKFLGAANEVTGSKHYLETPDIKLLVDCGVFQGIKELRELNWQKLPVEAAEIDAVLLTHGHLDHVGYLPRLVRNGFRGQVLGTAPTLAIARIVLLDSAKIHEEEAERANREGYSKHSPALPFFTEKEAEMTLRLFKAVKKDEWINLHENLRFRFKYVGHIIGACFIELETYGKRFVFSGDIGREDDYLLAPPERPQWADYLIMESTYGHQLHPQENPEEVLADLVHRAIQQRGNLVIPSFAIERLQSLMYVLYKLYKKNKIPNIPVFVDSPMGANVLSVFDDHREWHTLTPEEFRGMCRFVTIITSYADTWKTIDDPRPKIIIAGSGMVTGGRVLAYLSQLIKKENTHVLLVGYQAEGTRGRLLLEGVSELKIFGKYVPVTAQIHHLQSLSAHADQAGLLHWLDDIKNIPEQVFLVHGEPTSLDALRVKIGDSYGWQVYMPKLFEERKMLV